MEWNTVTLEDGRQRHWVNTETHRYTVYDWLFGHVDWVVYDPTGEVLLSSGKSSSADEAKIAAEDSIKNRT